MKIFVSYTRDTRASLHPVLEGLKRLGHAAWYDEDLVGGDRWWTTILQRIRESDAFLAALSPSYFQSTPCFEERRYAIALGKPLLPVAIQSLRGSAVPDDLAQLQIINYSERTDGAAFSLAAAVSHLHPHDGLPDPLPPPPSTPLSYGPEKQMIQRPTLTYAEQLQVAGTLIDHANNDSREDQREAAEALLKELAARPDITKRVSALISRVVGPTSSVANGPADGAPEADASGRRERSQARQRVAELQAQLRSHSDARRWQAVLEVSDQILRLDAGAADPDGLTSQARKALAELERECRYKDARTWEEAGDWGRAASAYSELLKQDPNYRDVSDRQRVAEARADLNKRITRLTDALAAPDGPGSTGSLDRQ